ncbi:MAG: FAD-binding and (Fe-S)-binding domain-containing protein [Planctomycetia bacterium]|nr:FAD-binding and (Fe-S)-binding domain-containing protein [Planctomycetia bacterium]
MSKKICTSALEVASRTLPRERFYTDYLRRLAWGTDAGFYRLVPEVVVFPETVEEVSKLLAAANSTGTGITFRAAGTSLSGQGVSDSILLIAGRKWQNYSISNDGETIRMQPGLIGQRVNELLAPYKRCFSPDPASVKSAMIGGIIVNNASGMNCGTHANSDKVLQSVVMILPDGTVLDTGSEASRDAFRKSHSLFLNELESLKNEIRADVKLSERIRKKYAIKNVMGLNLLPFMEHDDPFDIMAHLLVGSEGTLAFLAEATVKTGIVLPYKASALLCFPDIKTACLAVQVLHETPVVSVELLDRKALASVEGDAGIPDYIATFGNDVTALLVESKAGSRDELASNIEKISNSLQSFDLVRPFEFTEDETVFAPWWAIRSGIFPSAGGMREPGTTCLIEDVAFHLSDLPEATAELQKIIECFGYKDGVIYGHALEGNFHFILNQRFDTDKEVARYQAMMLEVVHLVVDKYDGSLKAEHGTGRNMAPFVEKEWGPAAFSFMKRIKKLFDPNNILNPGVIFNSDPSCFVKNMKPLPLTDPTVDKCMECGFCEVNCLTYGLTLSSRQRIVIRREISRLRATGENPRRLRELEKGYYYLGNMTCAGDGLCATSCPMKINTGHLTHLIREEAAPRGSVVWRLGDQAGKHLHAIKVVLRPVLTVAHLGHTILGSRFMSSITRGLHRCGVPLWTPAMPKPHRVKPKKFKQKECVDKVVYFPSCINQAMGTAKGDPDQTPLTDKMTGLLQKAGYEVIFPKNMDSLCCGTIWESKGMPDIAERKTRELEAALLAASENGKYPVLCDQSPCLYRMRSEIKSLKLYEPVEFIESFLVDRLDFTPIDGPIAIHTTCSMTKMGLKSHLVRLAQRCCRQVIVPEEVGCCGFAGDKGFTHPEVNRHALSKLRPQLERAGVTVGYSNSRTCEIGLTTNGGVPYMSIVYLVDQTTQAKKK